MMTVEIVKRMKVKKIDLDKADVVKREVCSRDEVMHVHRLSFIDSSFQELHLLTVDSRQRRHVLKLYLQRQVC